MNLCAEIVQQDDMILYQYTTSVPLNMRDIYQCSIFISIARVKYLEGLHKLMNVCAIHSLCRHTNIKRTHFHLNWFFLFYKTQVYYLQKYQKIIGKERPRDNHCYHFLILIDVRPYLTASVVPVNLRWDTCVLTKLQWLQMFSASGESDCRI